jgi:hypothetical protein
MHKTLFFAAFLGISSLAGLAFAGHGGKGGNPLDHGLGAWSGSGVAYDASGAPEGTFSVALTRRATAAGAVRTEGDVTLPSGQKISFWQEEKTDPDHPNAFQLTTNRGSGGGTCYSNGVCQEFESTSDGHAYATTLALDGDAHIRLVTTELQDGTPTGFTEQTLSLVSR